MNGKEIGRRMRVDTTNEIVPLIQRLISGDDQAFSELYDATIQDVFQTVHFLMEDKSAVEDVTQEIYIGLHESILLFDPSRPFRPWLMGLVVRQVNAYRRKRWMYFRISIKNRQHTVQEMEPDFSNRLLEDLSNQELLVRVEKLPYKLKQVIILRYLRDYSQEEVAEILSIPVGTVKSRIHAALKKLREGKTGLFEFYRQGVDQREYS